MKFPNAHSGVKKIFIAEILEIISAVLALVMATLSVVALASENVGLLVGGLALAAATGIIAIVGFIMRLVGLHQSGKDEPFFRTGFWVVIISILLTVVSTTFKFITNVDFSIATSILDTLVDVSNIVVIVYIISGIGSLAADLGNDFMVQRSKFLVYAIVGLYIISIALGLVSSLVKNVANPILILFGVFSAVAAVIELVVYILTLIHIGRAVKMLEK